jgi:hypothetical protein
MKKLLTVVVAAVIVMSFSVQAHSFEAFLSYWNGEDTDNGYGLGVGHQIKIIPIVFADVRASWLSFGDADMNVYPLEGLVGAKLGIFYLGVGPGYYIFSGKDVSVDNAWGAFGVGGINFTIAKIGAFGELKYTWVETKIEDTIDVDGSGIGVNVGVVFGWL